MVATADPAPPRSHALAGLGLGLLLLLALFYLFGAISDLGAAIMFWPTATGSHATESHRLHRG
jgi:hypothetical protein